MSRKIDPMNNLVTVKKGSGTFTVQVHGRTNDDKWQISLSNADKAAGDRAWIFVSFDGDGTDRFYIDRCVKLVNGSRTT